MLPTIPPQQRSTSSLKGRFAITAISLAVLAVAAFSCTSSARERVDYDERPAIDRALDRLERNYESGSILSMMDCFDPDYQGLLEVKGRISDLFFSTKEIEIKFVLDTFIIGTRKISAEVNWYRKIIDQQGRFSKSSGHCRFVFTGVGRELKLKYITGDNPFI